MLNGRISVEAEELRAPELIRDLIDKSADILEKQISMQPGEARQAALAIVKQLTKDWGGQQIYIPKAMMLELSERDHQLYSEFNGHNQPQLAKKYGISVVRVYQIIDFVRTNKFLKSQKDLFNSDNKNN